MEWNIDVHKYLSEITRTALKVIVDFGVTSASDNDLITKAEHKMADLGVYKSKEAAEGRIRRALFTYFKNYNLMYEDTTLTPIGKIFQEERISIKEFAFYYLANYKYQVSTDEFYYPLELIIKCVKEKQKHTIGECKITSYDFSKLVACQSIDDIDDVFISDLIANSTVILEDKDRRSVGFDVWQNLLCSAGLFSKGENYSMIPCNQNLIDWISTAYSKKHPSIEGEVITGILQDIPLLNIDRQTIPSTSNIWNETNALQAFLFDSVSDDIISKYIYEKRIKEINVYYNHYYNVNEIVFEKKRLFPLNLGTYENTNLNSDFVIETDVNELLSNILSLSICYQIKIIESNSFASENVMRQKITNESLDKIEKIEEIQRIKETKEKKEESFKKQINNYKNIMR